MHIHQHHTARYFLLIAVCLTFAFAAVEALAGWWIGSLTLLSDAGHMAGDGASLAIAAVAAWIATRPASVKHSYGLGRAEVIAAWFSSLLMLFLIIIIVIEAIERFHRSTGINGDKVIFIGVMGLSVNVFIAWLLSRGERTLNTRAALVHVIGDLLGSIAAIISGAIIHFSHWVLIDPISSLFICFLILFSTLRLLRESLLVLMEGVPIHLSLTDVAQAMSSINTVKSVHDLHIWTLSSGKIALTAHIEIEQLAHWPEIFKQLHDLLGERFSISHVTLQPETSQQNSYHKACS